MAQPLISILAHSAAKLGDQAISSLLGQSYPNWELLIVDDPLSTSSRDWRRWAEIDRRIRLLPVTAGRSRGAGLNEASRHARGEWIGYFDPEVELFPEFLDRAVAACASADVVVSGFDVMLHDVPGGPVMQAWNPEARRSQFFVRNIAKLFGVIHRRELLERVGGFHELLSGEEDWDLLKRFARMGAEFVFLKGKAGRLHVRGGTPTGINPVARGEGVARGEQGARFSGWQRERMEANRREGKPVFGTRSGWMFPKKVERILFASVHCLLDYTNGASLAVLQAFRWLKEQGFQTEAFCLCDHADPGAQHLGGVRGSDGGAERHESASFGTALGGDGANESDGGRALPGTGDGGGGRMDSALVGFANPPQSGRATRGLRPGEERGERGEERGRGRSSECSRAEYETVAAGIPVTVRRVEQNDPWRVTGETRKFLAVYERLLAEHRPDVVVTYGGDCLSLAMMEAAKFRDIPVVFWLHNFGYPSTDSFQFVDRVIVPSEFSREYHWNRLGLDCCAIPNFIDWERVELKEGDRHRQGRPIREESQLAPEPVPVFQQAEFVMARKMGPAPAQGESPGDTRTSTDTRPPSDRAYVTFVNPEPVKGGFVFAAIARELAARRPEIPLLVVEGRSPASALKAIGLDISTEAFPNVTIRPRTADPREFYAVSKLVLMPSLWNESFGLVAAEALINGIPVIASDRGALPEVVGDGGTLLGIPARYTPETREIPTAEEIEPWVTAIIDLWDNPERYEAASARARSRAEQWRPENIGPRFAEFFANVSPQPAPPIVLR